ncbi:MAG: hypothetical protein QOJ20_5646, partial [Mycobacterium sp.]|nr:hypothetical protein [Mycobacterium sp.]
GGGGSRDGYGLCTLGVERLAAVDPPLATKRCLGITDANL